MIIDTNVNAAPQIVHLQADNITTVIRYLTSNKYADKLVRPAEAKALALAGIRLGLVFENYGGSNGVDDITAGDGAVDAKFAVAYAPTVGAPADNSVCIYFAVDDDKDSGDINNLVLPYFRAISQGFAGSRYLVGVYGSGAVCQAVTEAGYASYAWLSQSMGWTDSREYLAAKPPALVLLQGADTTLANLDCDTNTAFGEFGDFLPTFATS